MDMLGKIGVYMILLGGVVSGIVADPPDWDLTGIFVKILFKGDLSQISNFVTSTPIPTISIIFIALLGFLQIINRKILGIFGFILTIIWMIGILVYIVEFRGNYMPLPNSVYAIIAGYILVGIGSFALVAPRKKKH